METLVQLVEDVGARFDRRPALMIRPSFRTRTVRYRDLRAAVMRVREGTGHSLRRQATTVSPAGQGWSQVAIDFTDTDAFAEEICSFGPDVVAESPPDLRESVIRRLTGSLQPAPSAEPGLLAGEAGR